MSSRDKKDGGSTQPRPTRMPIKVVLKDAAQKVFKKNPRVADELSVRALENKQPDLNEGSSTGVSDLVKETALRIIKNNPQAKSELLERALESGRLIEAPKPPLDGRRRVRSGERGNARRAQVRSRREVRPPYLSETRSERVRKESARKKKEKWREKTGLE